MNYINGSRRKYYHMLDNMSELVFIFDLLAVAQRSEISELNETIINFKRFSYYKYFRFNLFLKFQDSSKIVHLWSFL